MTLSAGLDEYFEVTSTKINPLVLEINRISECLRIYIDLWIGKVTHEDSPHPLKSSQ